MMPNITTLLERMIAIIQPARLMVVDVNWRNIFFFFVSSIRKMEETTKRLEQVMTVMSKLRDDLKLPMGCAAVLELKSRLSDWVKTGAAWSGTIDFREFGRMAEVNCPKNSEKLLEVRLRVVRAGKPS
jgi:hypothetical protein